MAEQTVGERIAAEFDAKMFVSPEIRSSKLAAAIDAEIAAAREEEKQYGRDFTEENNAEWQKIVDAKKEQLAAKDAGEAAMREALLQARMFMQYARYELEEKHANFEQFPCQECCDKKLAIVEAALSSTAGADLLARLRAVKEKPQLLFTELEMRLLNRALTYCPCQQEELMSRVSASNKLQAMLAAYVKEQA